ncbi:MAG: ribonuclease HII [Clostridia bacterium]|nr:ribonuclease HII [Clostridia bacterium]
MKKEERLQELLYFEKTLWQSGVKFIAGADEVGRGPLAGPVVVAAVILNPATVERLAGVDDSKKLSAKRRQELNEIIKNEAVCWSLGWRNSRQIDNEGIAKSIQKALGSAVNGLSVKPQHLLLDAFSAPQIKIPQTSIIKGDSKSATIAAASIIAKCFRDDLMIKLDGIYPEYGFYSNKGYGTGTHIASICEKGRCPQHRLSFKIKGVDY